MTDQPTHILYLDIDSTVRKGATELGHFVNRPEDVDVFPEAVTMMQRWKDSGGRIVGVSNQGGIALGLVSLADVIATMAETYNQAGRLFDRIVWCRHHPAAADPEMARCWCRKPAIGLIVEAAISLAEQHQGEYYPPHLALMVGDRPEDQACAAAASINFVWASDWRSWAT